MDDELSIPNNLSKTDQLGSTRPNLSNQSKGGSITRSSSIMRKNMVEECMLNGMSIAQMVALELGSKQTISNDLKEIHHQWLEKDPEWIERVRLARIEVEKKYGAQIQRLLAIINSNNTSNKDKLYAESLVTTIINKKYEISSSIDPEEYIKKQLQEKIDSTVNDKT